MPFKLNELTRHHIPKQGYKVSNWSDYNQALKNRGRIDLWLSDDIETWWTHPERVHDGVLEIFPPWIAVSSEGRC